MPSKRKNGEKQKNRRGDSLLCSHFQGHHTMLLALLHDNRKNGRKGDYGGEKVISESQDC